MALRVACGPALAGFGHCWREDVSMSSGGGFAADANRRAHGSASAAPASLARAGRQRRRADRDAALGRVLRGLCPVNAARRCNLLDRVCHLRDEHPFRGDLSRSGIRTANLGFAASLSLLFGRGVVPLSLALLPPLLALRLLPFLTSLSQLRLVEEVAVGTFDPVAAAAEREAVEGAGLAALRMACASGVDHRAVLPQRRQRLAGLRAAVPEGDPVGSRAAYPVLGRARALGHVLRPRIRDGGRVRSRAPASVAAVLLTIVAGRDRLTARAIAAPAVGRSLVAVGVHPSVTMRGAMPPCRIQRLSDVRARHHAPRSESVALDYLRLAGCLECG
mmetsp:Transcript_6422/g.18822  ORF Transcript_6422/g.18822 Transcript_6422/m.18822 type:complete len:333 (-) Transcript_6422:118-1116(-)